MYVQRPNRMARLAPVSLLYLALLLATSTVLASMGSRGATTLLRSQSTNVHNMLSRPLEVLGASALWIDGWNHVLLWAVPFVAVMVIAERQLGSKRLLAVFAIGHIGATLLTFAGIWVLLQSGYADWSLANTIDVGVSYGLYAVAAVLTCALPGRARWLAAATLLASVAGPIVVGGSFTDVGHLCAIALGFATYPWLVRQSCQVGSTPAGNGTSNALSVNDTSA